MFEAIRSRLVGAWKDLHQRGLPSLFIFELVVVTLGVLLAQSIADWAERRSAFARMEAERVEILEELERNLGTATLWRAALPCLQARLESVFNDDGGVQLAPGDMTRPGVVAIKPVSIDRATLILLRQKYGSEEAERLEGLLISTQHVRQSQENLVQQWGVVRLADPARSRVDTRDMQAASENAAFLLGQLVGIDNSLRVLQQDGEAMGLKPTMTRPVRPARTCDEIWEAGDLGIPLEGDD